MTAGLQGPAASADTTGGYLVSNTQNASDPDVVPCNSDLGQGMCLYSSTDMSSGALPGNGYPMSQTHAFFLPSGADPSVQGNWQDKGVVFGEDQITTNKPGGLVPSGANHLWAPDVSFAGDGQFTLLVPDVTDTSVVGMHTKSEIFVAKAANPYGAKFAYTGAALNINHYASDPNVIQTMDGSRHLVYANGDGDTCGDLNYAELDPTETGVSGDRHLDFATNTPGAAAMRADLGTCRYSGTDKSAAHPKNGDAGHAYLEGPTIYWTPQLGGMPGLPGPFILEFAAKPDHVPAQCAAFGQPNTANEVIAYATANDVGGPYDYQGILMCGSPSTNNDRGEWTNQASLAKVTDITGSPRLALVYHDGPNLPGSFHARKAHAECLYYGNGHFAMVTRNNNNNFQSKCIDYGVGLDGRVALRSQATGKIVSSNNGTSSMFADRSAVGPWEKLVLLDEGGGFLNIRADVNDKYVQDHSSGGATRLYADATTAFNGSSAEFRAQFNADHTSVTLFQRQTGQPVSTVGGELRVGGAATTFDILHP